MTVLFKIILESQFGVKLIARCLMTAKVLFIQFNFLLIVSFNYEIILIVDHLGLGLNTTRGIPLKI